MPRIAGLASEPSKAGTARYCAPRCHLLIRSVSSKCRTRFLKELAGTDMLHEDAGSGSGSSSSSSSSAVVAEPEQRKDSSRNAMAAHSEALFLGPTAGNQRGPTGDQGPRFGTSLWTPFWVSLWSPFWVSFCAILGSVCGPRFG